MPAKTFYLLGTAGTSPDFSGSLQDGGSTPTAVQSPFGFSIGTATAAYYRSRLGANAETATHQSTTYLTGAPAAGTAAGNTTAADYFRSPAPLTGTFAAGNWTFSFAMRTAAATTTGRINFRVWASTSQSGTSARELTSGAVNGSTVTMNATATDFVSSATWAAPAITLNNEYLFFQLEWQETVAGTSASCDARFWISTSTIVTTNLQLQVGGWINAQSKAQGSLATVIGLGGSIRTQAKAQGSVNTVSAGVVFGGCIGATSAARLGIPALRLNLGGTIKARSAATAWMPATVPVAGRIKTASSGRLLQRGSVLIAARGSAQAKARGALTVQTGAFRAQWGVTVNTG